MRDASAYRHTAFPYPEAELAPRRFSPLLAGGLDRALVEGESFRPDAPTAGEPLAVYASEGRWVVQCPDCNSAQLASHVDPRFMCHECGNLANGGAFRPLLWPANRAELEELLHARPLGNQNWTPAETIVDVAAINAVKLPKAGN